MKDFISELKIELKKSLLFVLAEILFGAIVGAWVGFLFDFSWILTTIIILTFILSTILYSTFKIYRRHEKEKPVYQSPLIKRFSRVKICIVCSAIVVALSAFASIVYALNIKTSYYNTITERFGLPYGIGEQLSLQEQSAMSDYWELRENRFTKKITATFVTKSGPLTLLNANSTLYSMNVLQNPSSIVYTYTGSPHQPTILRAEYRKEGKTILRLDYQTDSDGNLSEIVTITSYHGSEGQKMLQCYLFSVPANNYRALLPQATITVQYNDDGSPRERILQTQAPAYSAQSGIFGERYTYDNKGRLAQLTFLDENKNPKSLTTGIMSLCFSYTGYDQILQIRYYADDIGRTPIAYRGAPIHTFAYDENNYNLISRSFRDKDENPVCDGDGVYTYNYNYENLSLVRESYLGASGQDIYVSRQKGRSKTYAYNHKNASFEVTVNRKIAQNEIPTSLPDSVVVEDTETLDASAFETIYAIADMGDEAIKKRQLLDGDGLHFE